MKRHITILLLTLSPALAHAGGGGGGDATEVTQLMNNIELVAQVGEAVQTTSNTLQTAYATMQQLRQLDPSLIEEMTGLPVEQVSEMAEAYEVFSQAQGVYQDASDVLAKAKRDAERLKVSPSDLLRMKADVAYKYGGVYRKTYEQEQAKLAKLTKVSADVQKQAERVKKIDSTVGGVQLLANQNVQMQGMLVQLNDSIATANAQAAQRAAEDQQELAEGAAELSKTAEAYRKARQQAEGTIQLPTEIQLTPK